MKRVIIFILLFISIIGFVDANSGELKKLPINNQTLEEKEELKILENNIEIYRGRLENLESRYIDTVASEKNLNFWLVFSYCFAGILVTISIVILGYTIYQKGKFQEKAEEELEKISNIREKIEDDRKEEIKEFQVIKDSLITIKNNIKDEFKNETLKMQEETIKMKDEIQELVKEEISNIDKEGKKVVENSTIWSKAWSAVLEGNYDLGIELFKKYIDLNEEELKLHAYYNIGCAYALKNDLKNVLKNLKYVLKNNFFDDVTERNNLYVDEDFNNVRKEKEFKEFIQKVKDKYGDK